MAIGVALLWAGTQAERTPTELWLTRCYFGNGGEHHEVWTDRQQTQELTALNALVADCRAEMDFNDDDWGIKEFFTGYDTIRFKLLFGHFHDGHGAYHWTLQVQNSDGQWLTPTQGYEGIPDPTPPQMSAITRQEADQQREAARRPIVKNYQDSKYLDGHVMHVEGSFEVDTSRCQNSRLEATYWPEKADKRGKVTMRLAKED